MKTQNLNKEQRYIIDRYIHFARDTKKAIKGWIPFPKPPLVLVEGFAGSGKSTLISVLSQWFEKEMRSEGDNPDMPYLLKGCFTADASTIIDGKTLHTLFRLRFGNKSNSLSDKVKDQLRDEFRNMKLLILDEYSMIKSDQLYQIDARLKELKLCPNEPFGGIAVLTLFTLRGPIRPIA